MNPQRQPFRLALVGAGAWARRMHVPAVQRLQKAGRVVCVGVADIDPGRATEVGRMLQAPAFADLDRLLREARMDGIALLVSPPAMASVIRRVVQERIPFLCEKPPAPDRATQEDLIGQVGDLFHVVGYNRRFAPYLQRAMAWMEGHPRQLVCGHFMRSGRYDADFSSTAVHPLDTLLWMAQDDLAEARLEFVRAGQARNAFLTGWTRRGIRIHLEVCPDTALAVEHYEMAGPTRAVRVAFPYCDTTDFPGGVELFEQKRRVGTFSAASLGVLPEDADVLNGILAEYEALIALVRGGRSSPATLASTLPARQLADAWRTPGDRVSLTWSNGSWGSG